MHEHLIPAGRHTEHLTETVSLSLQSQPCEAGSILRPTLQMGSPRLSSQRSEVVEPNSGFYVLSPFTCCPLHARESILKLFLCYNEKDPIALVMVPTLKHVFVH